MGMLMLRGNGGAWFLPSVASFVETTGGPTLAEITAGISITAAISEITGLEPSRNPINIPLLKYQSEAQIDGPTTFQSVSIGIPDEDGLDSDADALERMAALTTLVKDASGVLVLSRTKQTLVAADKIFMINIGIDAQVPVWDMGASYARTNIACSPSTSLLKGVVIA